MLLHVQAEKGCSVLSNGSAVQKSGVIKYSFGGLMRMGTLGRKQPYTRLLKCIMIMSLFIIIHY